LGVRGNMLVDLGAGDSRMMLASITLIKVIPFTISSYS
jgi:hypothetical protein